MVTGRDGRLHFLARSGSGDARCLAQVRNRSHASQHRILRRPAVRALHDRLGSGNGLGTNSRSLRTRPHIDVHRTLVFSLHLPGRFVTRHLVACALPIFGRHRHRRRMVHRRFAHLRILARTAPHLGWMPDAYRLLRRLCCRRVSQLLHRQSVWLEMDVRRRRRSRVVRRIPVQ